MSAAPWLGRTPRAWQERALDAAMAAMRSGTKHPLIHACTGAGKSVVIAEFAARCKGSVVVTTPTQALVDQLSATIDERCPGEVGRAYQHQWDTNKRIVVTCNPSLPLLLDERPKWDAWIADEAHRLEGDSLRVARDRIERKVAIGFTATPYRADDRGLVVWNGVVYSYTSADAVRDGVLVPWRIVNWDGEGEADTDAVCERWIRDAGGRGIVSATSIADAEAFAERVGGLAIHGRLKPPERDIRLVKLAAGHVPCLVHVQLLTEGIDLPWLRYLVLRRKVSSPVRVVQEVGRVLRSAPDKTEAVIYDPHNTMEEVGLDHPSALEDVLERGRGTRSASDPWDIPELDGLDIAKMPPPVAVDRLSAWSRDLIGALRLAGLAKPPPEKYADEEAGWRYRRATPAQRTALDKLSWASRYLPDERHRKAVKWVTSQDSLRAGTASNLIDALRALADASAEDRERRRHYKLLVNVPDVPGAAAEEAA